MTNCVCTHLGFVQFVDVTSRKCREANEQLTMKLNETLADYANVVPRRHYELLEKEYEVSLSFFCSRDFHQISG